MSAPGPPRNRNSLRIDDIVASQPELGPSPPDGGWGWIVLMCSVAVQMTVPSITIAYGMLVLYLNLQDEYEENQVFHFWDQKVVMVPVSLVIFSLLSTSWSKTVVKITNRPRLVSICGVCLISAGILLSSIGIDSEEDAMIFNIFAGLVAGIGTSLTEQQSETLLKHYFRAHLNMVMSIYKTSVILGNILISILMGTLYTKYEKDFCLILYAGIIFLNALILFGYTRPTYIVAPIQKKYRELQENSEDDDEEIYTSQANPSNSEPNVESNENHSPTEANGTVTTIAVHDEEQDEEVISTFNAANTTREVIRPNTSRMESQGRPYVIEDHTYNNRIDDSDQQPGSLYRETTVAYGEAQTNIFTFEPLTQTAGAAKRTENARKNLVIVVSSLRDVRFYVRTYITMNVKLSLLVLGLFLPAYASQEIPSMDMIAVTFLVVIVYIGSGCLGIVVAFLPNYVNRRFFIALFSVLSFFGLLVLAESHTKMWLISSGTLSIFAVSALNALQEPIESEGPKIEHEANFVTMLSNVIISIIITIIVVMGNFEYAKYFRIAGGLHMFSPILLALVRRTSQS